MATTGSSEGAIVPRKFLVVGTTLFFAFSVVLHLMLLLLILPATLSTNHSKHVETSYIVLKLTFSVHNIS
jgi:hypothetical protein